MQVSTLLADPEAIRLEAFVSETDLIVLRVRVVRERAVCPLCVTDSKSIHSRYVRRIADLPWQLKEREKPVIDLILQSSPEIEEAIELGREFENLLMRRSETSLDAWLGKARTSLIAEIKLFARSLIQDKSAVQAAIKYEWSQGQVEGQVNRLKLIKRQMYGRAKFDLLKARVTHQA